MFTQYLLCWEFLSKMDAEFCQMLFLHVNIETVVWFLSFIVLTWWIALTGLQMLNHPYIFGIHPTWSRCMILLMYWWIQFAKNLLRILHTCSSGILPVTFCVWHPCPVLVSGKCWPHKICLEEFCPLLSFGRVWERLILILLLMFDRIHLWSHLVLGFCLLEDF